MSKQTHPQWQNAIRESQLKFSTSWGRKDITPEQLAEENRNGIAGQNLRFVLENVVGVPVGMRVIARNWFALDSYWFSLKTEADGNEEKQPVYASTSSMKNAHRADKSRSSLTFTLWVGKVNIDPAFDGWPGRKAVVVRNFNIYMGNYDRIRNELADALDELEAEYQAVIPRYQAWKLVEMNQAAELQDFMLQAIRQALKQMPAAEIREPKPIEVYDVELAASEAIAHLDGMIANIQQPKEFDGVDLFDPDDVPDDLDDADDEDDDEFDDDETVDESLDSEPEPETV